MRAVAPPLLLWLTLAPTLARASAHAYARDSLYATNDAAILVAGAEGVFASRVRLERETTDVRKRWLGANPRVADGRAYVRLDALTFERPRETARARGATGGASGLVEAATFKREDVDRIGVWDDEAGARKFCCTGDMAKRGLCEKGEVGRLVVRGRGDGGAASPWKTEIWFEGDDVEARSDVQAVSVRETGMYYMWFVVCDPEHAGVTVSGRTLWKNPDGYLPGAKTALLPFYGFAAMAYLGLGFAWAMAYVGNWRHVLELHNCITVVLALSMCETAVWYFDYANWNATGYRPYVFTVVAVLLGSLRTTLSRTLVLMMSMGYGVVRPTLGGLNAKVVSLSVCYLFSTAVKDVVEHVGSVDDLKPGARLFLVLPVSVFDSVFLIWIFNSLSRTLTQLVLRQQKQKLSLYRAFTNLLAANVVLSVGWLAYEMWFKSTDMIEEKWESVWMLTAFWQALSFGLLAGICFLWRPASESTQYAYSELANDISEDAWWGELITNDDIEQFAGSSKMSKSPRVMNSAKKTRAMNDFSLDADDDSAAEIEMEMGKID